VTSGERPLDLGALSPAEKDRVILGLWTDLREERAKSRALEERLAGIGGAITVGNGDNGSLRDELRRRGTRKGTGTARKSAGVRLGRGLGFLKSPVLIGLVAVTVVIFALDFGVGWYQQRQLAQKRQAELRLQQAAFANLFIDLVNIAYEPDGKSYRLTQTLQNLDPEHPIYVMLSPVRVFEQSGLVWHEVPAQAPHGQSTTVVKLTDKYSFQTIFEPNLKDWAELIPGYMHIRFDNDMLISQRSDPDDDIIERDDPYYVYLKPFGADDEAIRKAMKYTGPPPVFIPMRAH
jgi:hypothetical protein